MDTYIKTLVGLGLWSLVARYGAASLLIPFLFIVPIVFVMRWNDEMANRFPRWLGGMNTDAPPSILDTDVQAIVREEKQKVTKTDEDGIV